MPDDKRHRGPHPADAELFDGAAHAVLRTAVAELSWLLERGYAEPSSLKLVGDRYQLHRRQRQAVRTCAEADTRVAERLRRRQLPGRWSGRDAAIDALNVLITVELALAGGVVLVGNDGCFRDLASVHGSYRHVQETDAALEAIGRVLEERHVGNVGWYVDRPVSNSGRLAARIRRCATRHRWDWAASVIDDPDRALVDLVDRIVMTSDSGILDRCGPWGSLTAAVVNAHVPTAHVVDLREDPPPPTRR